jgi:putative transposase
MMDDIPLFFRDRYRVPSARLEGRNYAENGSYFVTTCTKGRAPWFGDIRNGQMFLSDIGRVVDEYWKQISIIRPFITLDDYVVMPDHVHGIICIRHVETPQWGVSTENQNRHPGVSTDNPHHRLEWKPHSLGSIINQFKSACTKRIRTTIEPDFAWQPRFHDRVIRSHDELCAIREYIRRNPEHWGLDDNY